MNYNKLPKEYGKFVELKDTPNISTMDGWESPISIVTENIMKCVKSANSAIEGKVMEAIVNVGIDVNKDELIKAMQYDRDQYSKGYTNGYNAGYNADKWISVQDRLPDRDELVLCIGAKGGMFLGERLSLRWDGKSAYAYVPNSRGGRYAVYWMPLPEPPKMEVE